MVKMFEKIWNDVEDGDVRSPSMTRSVLAEHKHDFEHGILSRRDLPIYCPRPFLSSFSRMRGADISSPADQMQSHATHAIPRRVGCELMIYVEVWSSIRGGRVRRTRFFPVSCAWGVNQASSAFGAGKESVAAAQGFVHWELTTNCRLKSESDLPQLSVTNSIWTTIVTSYICSEPVIAQSISTLWDAKFRRRGAHWDDLWRNWPGQSSRSSWQISELFMKTSQKFHCFCM
jgi:hypothetical protein